MKARKFGSAGLVAAAAAAHCAGVSVWTPGVLRIEIVIGAELRPRRGRQKRVADRNHGDGANMPDGAMIVLTVFFENMPRV